nr:hypothetical protein GCM10025732_52870 [Glycomyces mayteni]
MREHLLVAEGAGGGAALAQALGFEVADLVEEPGVPHGPHAALDALVEGGRVEVHADADGLEVGLGLGERGGEGAGELHDFEGAHDAAPVRGEDRLRGLGVAGPEALPECGGAVAVEVGFEAGADRGVGAGEVHLVERGLHVQAGAADEDRPVAAGADLADRPAGEALVGGHVGGLGDVEDVEHVVGTPRRSAAVIFAVPMSMPR